MQTPLMVAAGRGKLLGERVARQGLVTPCAVTVADAVRVTTAIQAQDTSAARLGVRARSCSVTDADVSAALDGSRSVVRTWLMRGTIHLVTAADLRWLVRLIGPSVQRKARTRWARLGLTDELLAACLDALPDILGVGPLDRHEVRARLGEYGITFDSPDSQVHTHVLIHACTTGLVCRGPDRGRDSTFVLTDDWVPDAPTGPTGDAALAELARRYFAAYSPATAADFTTWSGLAAGPAIELIRDGLTAVDVDGRPGYRLGDVVAGAGVRLLPAFDNYVIGYRHRNAIVEQSHHGAVYLGGMIRPTVSIDGLVRGTWALDRQRGRLTVTPFRALTRAERTAVADEAADVARFLGRPVDLGYAQ